MSNTILQWRQSSYCANGACIQTTTVGEETGPAVVLFRDSKLGDASPILSFTPAAVRDFVDAVCRDDFTTTP